MNVRDLFLSLNGRIGRARFWLGIVVIWVVTLGLEWAFGVPITNSAPTPRLRLIDFAILLVTIYPTAAIAAKRLHDRDQSARYVWIPVGAFAVIQVGTLAGYFDNAPPTTWLELIVKLVAGAVALGFLIELGFRRGTPGPNRYGPDPAARDRDHPAVPTPSA